MEYPVAPGSLRLDVGRSDHLAPPFGFISDKIAELGRRRRAWKATEVRESLLDLWIGKSSIDLAIELVDEFGRGVLRRADAEPYRRLIARYEFTQCGDVRQDLLTHRGGHRQRAQFSGSYEIDRRGSRVDRYLYLSTEQIRKEAGAVMHHDQIDTCHHLEQFAEDVDRTADAW